MRRNWTLLWHPDEAQSTRPGVALPTHQVRRGPVLLASGSELRQTVDGKAIGVLDGVIFNAAEAARPLLGRGAPIADDTSLALHAVGWSGELGLASLRWHGTLAVVHQAQRAAIVARDWQGVGGLHWAMWRGGQALANTSAALRAIGLTPQLVPPGIAVTLGPAGVRWQPLPASQTTRAWFRDLPDELEAPTAAIWREGLERRLVAAVEACQRNFPHLLQEKPQDRAGEWLAARLPQPPSAHPDAIWTLAGADAWLGASDQAPLPLKPGPWPEPEPPEPLRVDDREARARRVRATWLPDVALEAARLRAESLDLPLVAPHLDPAVLAWLGAMPPALRPLA